MLHRSIEARLVIYPLFALACILMYQSTNAGLYYLIGMGVYFWAFAEGEVGLLTCVVLLRTFLLIIGNRLSALSPGHYRKGIWEGCRRHNLSSRTFSAFSISTGGYEVYVLASGAALAGVHTMITITYSKSSSEGGRRHWKETLDQMTKDLGRE